MDMAESSLNREDFLNGIGEVPRFQLILTIFSHVRGHLSFRANLLRPLEIDNIIVTSEINIHSAIVKLIRTKTRTQIRLWRRIRTWALTRSTDMDMDMVIDVGMDMDVDMDS
jgi:hypothetical protein